MIRLSGETYNPAYHLIDKKKQTISMTTEMTNQINIHNQFEHPESA
jgi:hypothetical protein